MAALVDEFDKAYAQLATSFPHHQPGFRTPGVLLEEHDVVRVITGERSPSMTRTHLMKARVALTGFDLHGGWARGRLRIHGAQRLKIPALRGITTSA
jgi:hypothetical protein